MGFLSMEFKDGNAMRPLTMNKSQRDNSSGKVSALRCRQLSSDISETFENFPSFFLPSPSPRAGNFDSRSFIPRFNSVRRYDFKKQRVFEEERIEKEIWGENLP